jgi:hypothetical protein
MQTRLSTKRQVAEIDLLDNISTVKRGKFYQHSLELPSRESAMSAKYEALEAESEFERKVHKDAMKAMVAKYEASESANRDAMEARECAMITKSEAREAEIGSERKVCKDAMEALEAKIESIIGKAYKDEREAHEAGMESERKVHKDATEAREAESESEQKAFKDAIQTHSINIKYLQDVLDKTETKLSTMRWATKLRQKKCLAHFEILIQDERKTIVQLKCKLQAQARQRDEDMESLRKAHFLEIDAQLKCMQDEREAHVSQLKAHREEQLESTRDAEREVCKSQAHLREMEGWFKSIQDSERKVYETQRQALLHETQAEAEFQRKAHHDALLEADHKAKTALQFERNAFVLRDVVRQDHQQGLLKSQRLAHTTHETKCLAHFESVIKDEREFRFQTQRLLELELETRMNSERKLETMAETYKVREQEFETKLLERVHARLSLYILHLNAGGSPQMDFMQGMNVD